MIKRPLIWILGAYVTGLYLAWLKHSFLIIILGSLCFFILVFLLMYRIKNVWISRRDTFLWTLPVLLLFGYYATDAQLQRPELYENFEQEVTCQLTGEITMMIEKQWGKALYVNNNEVLLVGEEARLASQTYLCENVIVFTSDDQIYQVGNQITVLGTLQKFSAATNPGQFNELFYYQIENIDFKMEADSIYVINARYSKYHAILGVIKQRLITVYDSILSEKESGALIAMLLGEKYLLKEEIKQLYQVNGISHILAISGLHISLLGMFVYTLLRRCKVPITLSTFLTIFFIYSYGVLTNFSVSTNRAVVMMVVLLLSTLIGKTYDMLSAMSLSAFLILLQNPLQIFSAGFLLSFAALLGIAVVYPCLQQLFQTDNYISKSLMISLSAQFTTIPLVIYFYYQIPVYSILTNLIILPFVAILTLTSIIAGIAGVIYLPFGIFLIGGSNYILKFYEGICIVVAKIPYNLITVGKPYSLRLFLYVALLVIFISVVRRYGKKYFIFIPFTAVCILILPHSNVGLEVTFLDVGQGDTIYMKSASGITYLVDGGSSDTMKVGKYRLQPFLLSQGTDCLDYVIITHSDSDHINGVRELIEIGIIEMKQLLLPSIKEKDEAYLQLEELALQEGIEVVYIKAGDMIIDGVLRIFCLHPSQKDSYPTKNSYSTVLSITYGEYDMLLTGDLTEDREQIVIDCIQNDSLWENYHTSPVIDYEVLKVSHHGSKYSTFEKFLSMIRPEISIISCGYKNRYGHPHQELLDRLLLVDSQTMITYETGAITIKTDGKRMEVEGYRSLSLH